MYWSVLYVYTAISMGLCAPKAHCDNSNFAAEQATVVEQQCLVIDCTYYLILVHKTA